MNITLFGKRAFADLVKDLMMRLSWFIPMGLNTRTSVLLETGEGLVNDEVEIGVRQPQAKEYLELPNAGRSKE